MGCGAGNYTLKLLQRLPKLEVTLVDLSRPMLDRAQKRVTAAGCASVRLVQGDIRQIELGEHTFDVILAAAVLHHLRRDDDWRSVFVKFHRALSAGGSLWIFDLVESELPGVQQMLWRRYAEYLDSLKGPAYRQDVFNYIEKEDTPRSLSYQLELLRAVGFRTLEVLHKNTCFAAFGAVK